MFVSVFSLLRIRGFLGSVVYLVYPTGRVRVSVCRRYWIWNPGLLYLSGWNRVYHLRVFSFNQSIILYICDMLRTAIIYSLVDICLDVFFSGVDSAFATVVVPDRAKKSERGLVVGSPYSFYVSTGDGSVACISGIYRGFNSLGDAIYVDVNGDASLLWFGINMVTRVLVWRNVLGFVEES